MVLLYQTYNDTDLKLDSNKSDHVKFCFVLNLRGVYFQKETFSSNMIKCISECPSCEDLHPQLWFPMKVTCVFRQSAVTPADHQGEGLEETDK